MHPYTAMRTNLIKEGIERGSIVSGMTMQLNSPELVEMAGRAGLDFAWMDCEHGSYGLESLVQMFRAADAIGITPIVRVPDSTPSFVMRVLDAGAMGIVIPNVESKARLEAVISAAKYKSGSNGGTRGACPGTRATWHQVHDWPSFAEWSNNNTLVWATIENVAGVQNIDGILSVPGLDAILLGPFDLSNDMGFAGNVRHPKVVAALEDVTRKAIAKGVGVVAVLFSATPRDMELEKARWLNLGVRIFCLGSDRTMIASAMDERVQMVVGGSSAGKQVAHR